MASRRLPSNALSFKQFMLRGRVITQYRAFMRAISRAPVAARTGLRQEVRDEFRKHVQERNSADIKALLAEGKKQLVFAETLATTANRASIGSASLGESWVGTGEAWDVRGRVGVHWPWGSSS